ncbi:Asp23/Gls24 family envelope stress response protein [Streptomonospora litoralis]|uniref:Asp23/Gls24 family envelope stress response protein n=1 Tax=Streptomonospora litoralis TaxID=2498135 RepID=A0A4P6Q0L3_9ACTN|nr:hypothetical protein [Streptomonospora litoralis]QBI52711.1 hypothetical protein EKD16_04520 [Streptomonospora litoralis]
MAVDPGGRAPLLPCGTDPEALFEHLRSGDRTAHERACPHCLAAAAEFGPLVAARGDLADEHVTAPPQLLDDVMRAVRADPRSQRTYRLAGEEAGSTRVRRPVAAAILRGAAEGVPGVAQAVVRKIRQETDRVDVRVSARFASGAAIPETAAELRRALRQAGRDRLGWDIAAVDVDVTDVDAPSAD